MRRERECGAENVDAVAFGAGAESSFECVGGGGAAGEDVTGEVGVDAVGGDVEGLAGEETDVVHCY